MVGRYGPKAATCGGLQEATECEVLVAAHARPWLVALAFLHGIVHSIVLEQGSRVKGPKGRMAERQKGKREKGAKGATWGTVVSRWLQLVD